LTGQSINERVGVAGSGAIACGLAAVAARGGEVVLWARSDASAEKAGANIAKLIERCGWEVAADVEVTTDLARLGRHASYLVEAIVEERADKVALIEQLRPHLADDAILSSTTSSLSIEDLAVASGRPQRYAGLHVFNPVTKMDLVELVFPKAATQETRDRSFRLCEQLGKTPVEVPDLPGFVVNRLLFPFLFDAVVLLEESRLDPQAIDDCMRMGAGHPMGPLALLDYVGLDVSAAIGRSIGAEVPARVEAMIAEGALGKKVGRGFYEY
jgi:3-hydroxybutyryl-CoA dehydrogenase